MTLWVPELPPDGTRYRALADAIAAAIADGELTPGQRLPPQRRLADALGVTVGTVTRAYAEAERRDLVEARVGSGTYVRERAAPDSGFRHVAAEAPPGLIDLSLSLPPPHPDRPAGLAEALTSIAADPEALAEAVGYQGECGTTRHRAVLARWLTALGLPMDADELTITLGGQHGIFLALHALTQPGERIACAALTYPGLINAAQQCHRKPLRVPLDDDGIDVDALARLCAQQPPRLVYVTPEQNNPTGARLAEARRHQLVELARRHDIWLVEDGVQYMPPQARDTPLYRLAPERTLYLFSTSKVIAGGLRVGVMRAPAVLHERLANLLLAQSWMVPPLMVEAVCRWIDSGAADRLLAWQIEETVERQRLAMARLAAYSPRGQVHGSHLWLNLPEGWRAGALLGQLERHGVRVTGGEPFCVGSEPVPQAIRLCPSAAPDRPALERALTAIATTLEAPAGHPWRTL
ncbi:MULTISPECIES: PLP-dependent aminotransferase family protein [unclassified Modicisalibacter]|uniref:aminotransferase-like domain-containing protein n=1 Tax=unclassified Modicisalibacter TaxID=2679913 RepID=UPI001CCC5B8F|nr:MULTISPECIES: PLP-dependent aminotransferase family protein [unclassified Modicisalibacter]MBZ9559194.1 PLP-dependent aminotransferase family protein [Modicisalibacter sp. R2A 31.J]MBZ9576641.1 PLP-dependent aminotransferase family protein [Modicisalibacter sp. MOD 31.J]